MRSEPSNSLGLLVRDLGASELNWRLVNQANERIVRGHDVLFFYETLTPVAFHPMGAILQSAESRTFRGPLIATTLSTAAKVLAAPKLGPRLFYLWDLEWVRIADRSHVALRKIYGDTSLQLVCRTSEHKRIVEDVWNRPVVGVVKNAELHELMGVFDEAGV